MKMAATDPTATPAVEEAVVMSPNTASLAEKEIAITSASSSTENYEAFDSQRKFDTKLAAKLDFFLLTPMFFLNFLSLMGRTNIGAALIQKLPADLHLTAMKVFLAISIALVPLIVLEIPSNLLMRYLEKKYSFPYMRYLSAITICLGE